MSTLSWRVNKTLSVSSKADVDNQVEQSTQAFLTQLLESDAGTCTTLLVDNTLCVLNDTL